MGRSYDDETGKMEMTPEQRAELMDIIFWTKQPSSTPMLMLTKKAVECFLNGLDAENVILEEFGVSKYMASIACNKGRIFIGNERAKRRKFSKQIREQRMGKKPEFTHDNFHVTIDSEQDRNYGMANVSIYCVVEVWLDENNTEREYLINFSDFKTKEWLMRMLVWALMNNREVVLKPATDHDMSNMRMFSPKDKEQME